MKASHFEVESVQAQPFTKSQLDYEVNVVQSLVLALQVESVVDHVQSLVQSAY